VKVIKGDIKVLNYSPSAAAVHGKNREYLINGAVGADPGVEFMDISEIDYINSRTQAFKTGLLEFESDVRDEVYSEIKLHNWKETALFERDIDDMLINPDVEKLQRIIAISDVQTFERVRGHMLGLVNAKEDVSSRVVDIVNARFDELAISTLAPSKIIIKPIEKKVAVSTEEVDALRAELEATKKMMQEMMSSMKQESKDTQTSTAKPKAGRPATKKTTAK